MRVRFWMDSSIAEARTRMIEVDCSRVKPEDSRRWTNLSVSKWWSLLREGEAEKVRWRQVGLRSGEEEEARSGEEEGSFGALWLLLRRDAQAVRAKAVVAVVRWAEVEGGNLCCAGTPLMVGRMADAVQERRGRRPRESDSVMLAKVLYNLC